jgi:hypothetical protein
VNFFAAINNILVISGPACNIRRRGHNMYKMGQAILIIGITIFLVVGGGMIMGIFPKDEPLAGPLFIIALILTGAGASISKKYREKD